MKIRYSRMAIRRLTTNFFVASTLVAGLVSSSYAATIIVNNSSGTAGAPPTQDCRLVDAITAANMNTAVFGCTAGTVPSLADPNPVDHIVFAGGLADLSVDLAQSLPVLTGPLIISGPPEKPNGTGLMINGQGAHAIFSTTEDLTISNVSLVNSSGRAIVSSGTNLTINSSTISGSAGGVEFNGTTLSISNSTFSGNTAATGSGILVSGGTTTIESSTIANNSGAMYALDAGVNAVTLINTVIGSNANSDCQATATTTASHIEDASCNATASGDPQLTALQDNGGPTFTHAPVTGSPLINGGDNNAATNPVTDQRGSTRIANGTIDIGAVELSVPPTIDTFGLASQVTLVELGQSINIDLDTFVTDTDSANVTITVGGIPPGLTFSESAGNILSGAPTTLGSYNLVIDANDGGQTATGSVNIIVVADIAAATGSGNTGAASSGDDSGSNSLGPLNIEAGSLNWMSILMLALIAGLRRKQL